MECNSPYEYINAGTTCSGFTSTPNCKGNVVTTPSRGQGGIGFVGFQYHDFWLGPLCYQIRSKTERVALNRYIYHYLSCHTNLITAIKNEGGTPALNLSDLATITVALPRIDVQKRLVDVLDNFDAICSDLNIGLPAEIEARQKQYEFYRDGLLTFMESGGTIFGQRSAVSGQRSAVSGQRSAEYNGLIRLCQYVFGVVFAESKKLEDCCIILDNLRMPVTKSNRESGDYPYYGANGIQDYVSDFIFDGTYILIGEDGSVITESGTPIITWASGKIWVNNHAHIIAEKDGVLLRYLYYFLQTVNIKPYIHGNIPKFTGKDLRTIQIAVPSLDIQRKIVEILDRFDTLCNDISEGIPAEIEARQKQYEYYRDKLFAFSVMEK